MKIIADDIMTEGVEVINDEMTVSQAAHLMLRKRYSGYPIVSAEEENKVVGIITLTDLFILIEKQVREGQANNKLTEEVHVDVYKRLGCCKDMKVKEIMSKKVIMISKETPLDEIVISIIDKHIHTFPVIEDGKLIGMVGRHDVLNAAFGYT